MVTSLCQDGFRRQGRDEIRRYWLGRAAGFALRGSGNAHWCLGESTLPNGVSALVTLRKSERVSFEVMRTS